MREIEFKFAVHPSFDLPEIQGRAGVTAIHELESLSLHSTYYDTVDLRLARNGVTLRHRRGEDGSQWTLKLPTGDKRAAIRDEIDFPASEDMPHVAAELVTGFTRRASLQQVAVLETKRSRWKLIGNDNSQLALVVRDEVTVIENERIVTRFREIELEALEVGLRELTAIGDALQQVGAVPSEPVPKAVRALGPRATAPSDVPPLPELGPCVPATSAIKALLARSVTRLISNHPAARLGNEEGVHQMRVAVRRLRSDLRTFGLLVEQSWTDEVIPELKWLAQLLGDVRDLDVLTQRFESQGRDLIPDIQPLFKAVAQSLNESRAVLYEGLRSDRYGDLLEKLVRSAQNPPVTPEASRPAAIALTPHVETRWKKLRRAVRDAGKDPTADALHQIRIRAKRARYAAEAVAPTLGARRQKAGEFGKAAARLQDVLGEHQDATVAQAKIQQIVGDKPAGSFALAGGRLVERQSRSAAEARSAWRKAWKRLDRKKLRSWLKE
jgi:CHAD domain-containing protein/adenylate cyclase class IV